MTAFLCLVGPPAVGKSTISRALADRFDVEVFRLREFAHQMRTRTPQAQHLFGSVDPLGWYGDGAVAYCLRHAFVEGWLPPVGVVVLENLPGSHVQMGQVHAVAAMRDAPLMVVELAAPDAVLRQRAGARRVCPVCEPDPHGDPHRPAPCRADDPTLCLVCGSTVAPRRADRPAVFEARLARFRERIADIRRGAVARGRPYHTVDAATGLDQCLDQVQVACGQMLAARGVKETVR